MALSNEMSEYHSRTSIMENFKVLQYAAFILLLAAIHTQCYTPAPLVVAETKGVQVKLAASRVAMGTLQLRFRVNLPSMEIKLNVSNSNCTAHLSGTRIRTCKTLHNIDIMSVKILKELETIFKKTDDLDELKTRRTKRSLLPIVGEGFGWLFGMTTDRELSKTISAVNEIGENLQALSRSHQTLINASQTNFGKLQEHQHNLESSMKYFAGIYNHLVSKVSEVDNEFDMWAAKMVGTTTLLTKINVLQTHLLALRSIYDKCQANLLPKIVVDENSLREALNNHRKTLDENALKLSYGTEYLYKYYELETAKCTLVNKQSLEINVEVPLTDAKSQWRVLEIHPVKFLHEGSTCQIVKSPVEIASNGIEIRDLSTTTKFGKLDIFMLPRENSQSDLSTCIHKLLKQADVREIAAACELDCVMTFHSTVQLFGPNKYSVLNPGSNIAIICGNVVKQNVPQLENGRVEIMLPCHCTVQEMSGPQLTLITSVRTCNENLNKNNTLTINMDWASDNFEPYELFVPARDYEKLKIKNVSFTPLTLVKLEPFDGSAIASWKGLPVTSSGWGLVRLCVAKGPNLAWLQLCCSSLQAKIIQKGEQASCQGALTISDITGGPC
ncbi:Retrovirus-related Env polyprotein from transposon 297 [Frankliniella fusca]|uniref:Retrovirus-related Env polyprotein from transposon 297 n=1 Tax=Frankliniella fusca TaxID=407009 RepID=A0AAE1LEV6_9NEOP|nr:Retrovirus-related Env polyprotein from transposon 297 [Frankliniella fusca]